MRMNMSVCFLPLPRACGAPLTLFKALNFYPPPLDSIGMGSGQLLPCRYQNKGAGAAWVQEHSDMDFREDRYLADGGPALLQGQHASSASCAPQSYPSSESLFMHI